jgi:hypothetical protein
MTPLKDEAPVVECPESHVPPTSPRNILQNPEQVSTAPSGEGTQSIDQDPLTNPRPDRPASYETTATLAEPEDAHSIEADDVRRPISFETAVAFFLTKF